MSLLPNQSQGAPSGNENEINALYQRLLDAWNRRDAGDFAGLFEADGNSVGFDGSTLDGQAEIDSSIRQIFADHQTAA